MGNFEFSTTKKIINEVYGLKRIGELCQSLSIKKPLVVTDKGLVKLGYIQNVKSYLFQSNLQLEVFDGVLADPPEELVLQAVKVAINNEIDGIIGIGGGSSLDCAKVVSVLATQEQSLSQIYGVNKITTNRLPLILIPTTSGTGSEVTPISIITTGATTKAGIVSSALLPDIALLDAELTLDLPPPVTAATGIDAMVHAIEAYTSKLRKNPYSDMLAKQALKLLNDNIVTATTNGHDLVARQNMMLGACLAGQAFANAPVAAVHALAYPLGGHFHIPHGLSNSLVLPYVLNFNAQYALDEYRQISTILCPNTVKTHSDKEFFLSEYFISLASKLGLPTKLRDVGITRSDLPTLASDAMLQTRLLVNNPREVSFEDAVTIYQQAL